MSVTIEGERPIGVTPEHPFYVRRNPTAEGGWITADELRLGDKVLRIDGQWTDVTDVTRRAGGVTVYNFEVADNHDYFVGASGILVHNACLKPKQLAEMAERLEDGKDVIVDSVEHARQLLDEFPQLKPYKPYGEYLPGPAKPGTYRGDLAGGQEW